MLSKSIGRATNPSQERVELRLPRPHPRAHETGRGAQAGVLQILEDRADHLEIGRRIVELGAEARRQVARLPSPVRIAR